MSRVVRIVLLMILVAGFFSAINPAAPVLAQEADGNCVVEFNISQVTNWLMQFSASPVDEGTLLKYVDDFGSESTIILPAATPDDRMCLDATQGRMFFDFAMQAKAEDYTRVHDRVMYFCYRMVRVEAFASNMDAQVQLLPDGENPTLVAMAWIEAEETKVMAAVGQESQYEGSFCVEPSYLPGIQETLGAYDYLEGFEQ